MDEQNDQSLNLLQCSLCSHLAEIINAAGMSVKVAFMWGLDPKPI